MAGDIWDYLSTTAVTPYYTTTTLQVTPQNIGVEEGDKRVAIHIADDGSEERVVISSQSEFYVTLQWDFLTETDANTIFDFYHSNSKGGGMAQSFYWLHPTDSHTYAVRFAAPISKNIMAYQIFSIARVKLKILGRGPT